MGQRISILLRTDCAFFPATYRLTCVSSKQKTLSVPKTGMVVTSDLVDDIKDIHPQLKKEVGLRLANYALAETYGKKKAAIKVQPIKK